MIKTKFYWLLPAILCFFQLQAFSQGYKNSELEITKISPHSWIVQTVDHNTMYIIEGSKKALLIDTGGENDSLNHVIKKITTKPLSVVLTHGHGDHAGNIGYFKEIFMHPADSSFIDKSYKGKINYVKEGFIFDLGGVKIEVSEMPAHTPGSIILLDRADKLAYSGDAFGSGQVWLQLTPNLPISDYVKACDKMLGLISGGIDSIYCGHHCYIQAALDKQYITTMKHIAQTIVDGKPINAESYPIKTGCRNPMIAAEGKIGIVYNPETIK